jgi:hypothetical protein
MKLTAAMRKKIPSSSFAVPSKAPGSGSYPIPDASHARNALARSSGKPIATEVAAKVHAKYPNIGRKKKRAKVAAVRAGGSPAFPGAAPSFKKGQFGG